MPWHRLWPLESLPKQASSTRQKTIAATGLPSNCDDYLTLLQLTERWRHIRLVTSPSVSTFVGVARAAASVTTACTAGRILCQMHFLQKESHIRFICRRSQAFWLGHGVRMLVGILAILLISASSCSGTVPRQYCVRMLESVSWVRDWWYPRWILGRKECLRIKMIQNVSQKHFRGILLLKLQQLCVSYGNYPSY